MKSGNKRISTFITKVLPNYMLCSPKSIRYEFNRRYCFRSCVDGKWTPKHDYIEAGWFVQNTYKNFKTRQQGVVYYITPLGQAEIIKEMEKISPIGFGKGLAQYELGLKISW